MLSEVGFVGTTYCPMCTQLIGVLSGRRLFRAQVLLIEEHTAPWPSKGPCKGSGEEIPAALVNFKEEVAAVE